MIVYKDTTFCVNKNCKKKCKRYLTQAIINAAAQYGLPIATSEMICLDCGEDGIYEKKEENK